ncbi:DUF3306 domain-containing protein [Thiomonas sp.]
MTLSTTPPADRPGFLARWSQRKLQAERAERAEAAAEPPVASPALSPPPPAAPPAPPAGTAAATAVVEPAPPTRAELDALDHSADLSRFIARGVDEDLRRAALRKLFADPRFNVMDGLDVYIDDYNAPSPIPSAMLLRLQQAAALGFAAVDGVQPPPAPSRTADAVPDEAASDAKRAAQDRIETPPEPT